MAHIQLDIISRKMRRKERHNMSIVQNVSKIDDKIKIRKVLVSCTDKTGLISNEGMEIKEFPQDGLIGEMVRINPEIQFISTGNTYKLLKEAGVNVIEISEYTGYPEMKTGLVKSLHPKIHAGILGHIYTADDIEFMEQHNIEPIDAVIINFYDLQNEIDNNSDIESKRQAIDVGGPTLCHASRKSFIHTALIASKDEYIDFITYLRENDGSVSLKYRLKMAQKASKIYTQLMIEVDNIIENITYEELERAYEII